MIYIDKLESKARELLAEVEKHIADEKETTSSPKERSFGFPPAIGQYHFDFLAVLLKTQSLFYCTDPDMPLYGQSLELGKDWTKGASKNDFNLLRLMLQTYLEYLDLFHK